MGDVIQAFVLPKINYFTTAMSDDKPQASTLDFFTRSFVFSSKMIVL